MDLENISSRDELIKILKPNGNGIEIGVQQGDFAKHILENCTNLKLYLLDCWDQQSNSEYQDISNLLGLYSYTKNKINIKPYVIINGNL